MRIYTPVLDQINRSSDDYSFHVLFLEETWRDDRRTEPVSSLRDLMVRLGDLIDSTTMGDTIRYLAYTPALGFLAEKEDQWKSLHKSMQSKGDQMDMICLNEAELKLWHGKFVDKKTARSSGRIDEALCAKANEISEEVLTLVRDAGRPPTRKAFGKMPGFYLFNNSKRAIIVAPLGVPLLGAQPPIREEVRDSKVEMFGLDTNVLQIVQNAGLAFSGFRPPPAD